MAGLPENTSSTKSIPPAISSSTRDVDPTTKQAQHPSNTDDTSTAGHPAQSKPDPTTNTKHAAGKGPVSSTTTSSATVSLHEVSKSLTLTNAAQQQHTHSGPGEELAALKSTLRTSLRQFPDFPSPGILFEDITPLFLSHTLHTSLIRALELQIFSSFSPTTTTTAATNKNSPNDINIDIIIGLESRGFLFGPTLALRLGAGFVPLRKKGKLPGPCETASFEKEYGLDEFQIQSDAVKPGQRVVVVDDIIATGKSLYVCLSVFFLTVAGRWQCGCGGLAGEEIGRRAAGVRVYDGAGFSEGQGEVGCAGLYTIFGAGGEVVREGARVIW